jgi:hypothetical protein
MAYRIICIAILLLQAGPFAVPAPAAGNEDSKIQLTILANEGLLIRSGDAGILIDAFIDAGEAGSDLLAGRQPFSSIKLAIITHPHREHFDATTAGTFLKNNRDAVLVSSEEVIQAIRNDFPDLPGIEDRMREIRSDGGVTTAMTVSGIRLDFMLFSHEASEFYPEQVMPHIIHLAGKKILYIGDSEMRPENWKPYNLAAREIDIVILPLWLFKEESVRTIIDEYISPLRVVVAQIPARGSEMISELSKSFPEVVFLCTPMASVEF